MPTSTDNPRAVRDVIRTVVDDVRLRAAAAVDQSTRDELPFIIPSPDAFPIVRALNTEFGVRGTWFTVRSF